MPRIKQASLVTFYSDVPMSGGYQIVFRNRKQQAKYFEQHAKFANIKCSYVRRTRQFKAALTMEQAKQVNYMSFINPSPFENITYFAVIIDCAYINPKTTLITFELDAYQTFYDQVEYHPCVIQRQHMSVAKKALAAENPWRNDIPELCTVEDAGYGENAYRTPEVRYDLPTISHGDIRNTVAIVQVHGVNWSDGKDPYISFKPIESVSDEVIYPSGASKSGTKYLSLPPRDTTLIFVRQYPPLTQGTRLRAVLNSLTLLGLQDNVDQIFEVHRTIANLFLSYAGNINKAQFIHIDGIHTGYNNEKLYRAPYQYLRVSNRDSGVKEYKFEMSDMLQTPGEDGDPVDGLYISFVYIPFLYENPRAFLIPYGYHSKQNAYKDRMEFTNFQVVPWSTDAYYMFLGTQQQKMLMSQAESGTAQGNARLLAAQASTVDNGIVSTIGGMSGVMMGAGGSAKEIALSSSIQYTNGSPGRTGTVAESVNNLGGGTTTTMRNVYEEATPSTLEVSSSAPGSTLLKGVNETAHSVELDRAMAIRYGKIPTKSIYSGAKDILVANEYHEPASGANILQFLNEVTPPTEGTIPFTMMPGQFTFEVMWLRDSVLKVKDMYFDLYGYACGYRDLPLVVTYSLGADIDKTKIPTFADVDHHKLTYVKCEDMHVDHQQAWIANAISALFNAGCWFLDGESLITP